MKVLYGKKLYEFPNEIPDELKDYIVSEKTVQHKLTHKTLNIAFRRVELRDKKSFEKLCASGNYIIVDIEESHKNLFLNH